MAYKRQTDRLPMTPTDAKEHNVVCHYCIVGCGYKAYTSRRRAHPGRSRYLMLRPKPDLRSGRILRQDRILKRNRGKRHPSRATRSSRASYTSSSIGRKTRLCDIELYIATMKLEKQTMMRPGRASLCDHQQQAALRFRYHRARHFGGARPGHVGRHPLSNGARDRGSGAALAGVRASIST